jgi:hypothetical protein
MSRGGPSTHTACAHVAPDDELADVDELDDDELADDDELELVELVVVAPELADVDDELDEPVVSVSRAPVPALPVPLLQDRVEPLALLFELSLLPS